MNPYTTPEPRAALRAKAEEATPGPWYPAVAADGADCVVDSDDHEVCYTTNSLRAAEDEEYIAAAHPQAVLALLDALDAADARADKAKLRFAGFLLDLKAAYGDGDSLSVALILQHLARL